MKFPRPLAHPFPLVGLLLLPLVASVWAEEPAPAVSCDAIVGEIAAGNPELRFYEEELAAARIGHRLAGMRSDPQLSVELGRKRNHDLGGVLAGEGTAWSVTLEQTFEFPGRLALRKAIANRQIELAELGLARFQAGLRARARTLACGLQAAQEKTAVVQEVAERFRVLRELFLSRDPAGLTPLLETRVLEANEISLQSRATEASLAARMALAELNQLRGAPPDTPVRLAGAPPPPSPAPAREVLLAAAREANFDYRMKQVELEQQGIEVSLARHERYPSFTVSPFFSQEKAVEKETVVGIGVSVPLPLTSRSRAGIDLAAARRRQAEAAMATAQRQLEREVTGAAHAYEARLAAMSRWQPDAVGKFREAAALADRHFRLGAVPLATYIELQSAYVEAVEAMLDTQREALEARQQLELLTGLNIGAVEVKP